MHRWSVDGLWLGMEASTVGNQPGWICYLDTSQPGAHYRLGTGSSAELRSGRVYSISGQELRDGDELKLKIGDDRKQILKTLGIKELEAVDSASGYCVEHGLGFSFEEDKLVAILLYPVEDLKRVLEEQERLP